MGGGAGGGGQQDNAAIMERVKTELAIAEAKEIVQVSLCGRMMCTTSL